MIVFVLLETVGRDSHEVHGVVSSKSLAELWVAAYGLHKHQSSTFHFKEFELDVMNVSTKQPS